MFTHYTVEKVKAKNDSSGSAIAITTVVGLHWFSRYFSAHFRYECCFFVYSFQH